MSLRQGIVVAVHPEDHSVDLVMLDDGARLVGVQVLAANGSGKYGTFDMPPVPERASKWDISQSQDGDQIAIVGFMRQNPVVLGYMRPQVSQMTFSDGKRMVYRHQSDVTFSIEETGAVHLRHPGGLSISIGTPDDERTGENKNADDSFKLEKNTGQRTNIKISMPGFSLEADKNGIKISAKKITLDAPTVKTSGDILAGGVVVPNTGQSL